MPRIIISHTVRSLFFGGYILLGAMLAQNPVHAAAVDAEQSEKFFETAKDYHQKGNLSAAIIELKNALQKNAGNVAARLLLGKIYLDFNNGRSAEKEFKAARRRGAKDLMTRILLARAQILQPNRWKDVLATLKDDIDNAEMLPDVLVLRGRALLGLQRIDEAEAALRKSVELNAKGVDAKIGLARVLITRGDMKGAEKETDAALALDKNSVIALILKAELRRVSRDLPGAVAQFDKAIALQPNNLLARLGRSAALIDLNRHEDAEVDLKSVAAAFPRHPLAAYLNALVLVKKKDYEAAQNALSAAGAALDSHLPSAFLSGAIHYADGQFEQAVKALSFYVANRPNNTRARKLLGAALMRKKEPRQVIEVLYSAAEKSSADAQLLTLIGTAHMQIREFNRAAKYFGRAAEIEPDEASIQTRLALGNLAIGKAADAIGQLEHALDLDPSASRAAILLAMVKLRAKDYDGALEVARKMRKTMPNNPMARDLEGAALFQKGENAAARKVFQDSLEAHPNFHTARMRLALIDRKEGKNDAARARYKKVLELDPKFIKAMAELSNMAAADEKIDEAIVWLRRAAKADPKSIMPQMRLIRLHGRLRQFDKALMVAQALNRKFENNPVVLEILGRAKLKTGNSISAVSTFTRLSSLRPKSAQALGLLAGAQIAIKDPDSARETLERAIALDPNHLSVRVALIQLESRAGKFDRAIKLATDLRKSQKELPIGDTLVGDVLMRQKKFDEAVTAFEKGFAKAPSSALAIRRFRARIGVGATDKAFAELKSWVVAKKDRAGRQVLATAYISANRFGDAIRESETLLLADGKNVVMLNNLAWLYQQRQDGRAVKYAERALALAPKSPAIMDTLGWILLESGNHSRALTLLSKAKSLASLNGDIRYHYAVALDKNGKSNDAKRELQDLIDSNIKFAASKEARAMLKKLHGG